MSLAPAASMFLGDRSMTTTRDPEILPLTGLRALAALWVVVFHFGRDVLSGPVLGRLVASGHVAVDLFFALSGFVLTDRYQRSDLRPWPARRAFYRRRCARLYPVYLLSLALGFYAEWPHSLHDLSTEAGVTRLLAQLALLNALSHHWMFRLNWAAWSLSVEVLFYGLFPWLLPWVFRLDPRRLLLGCGLAVLVAPALYTYFDPDHLGRPFALGDEVLWSWYLKFFPIQRLPIFLAGMATARLAPRVALPPAMLPGALLALLAIIALDLVPYAFLQAGALLPIFVVALWALGRREARAGLLQRGLSSRGLVFLGRASYAIYILHVPLFLALARSFPSLGSTPAALAAYLALLILLSSFAHRGLEVPARKAILRAGRRLHPADTA